MIDELATQDASRRRRLALAGGAVTLAGLGALAAVLAVAPRGPEPVLTTGSVTSVVARGDAAATPDLDADLDAALAGMTAGLPATARPAPAPSAVTAALPSPLSPFAAIRDSGALRLTGAVASEAERAAILAFAQARFVAEPVLDEMAIDVAAAPTPEPVTQAALAALARLAEGQARLSGGAVEIEGRALYRQAGARVEADLGARLPEGWLARLSLSMPEAEPEPIIEPFPGRRAVAASDARAPGAQPAALAAAVTPAAAGTASPEAAAPSGAWAPPPVLPPLPQRASLADLENHPLPPRR